jgi:hypothetical protein
VVAARADAGAGRGPRIGPLERPEAAAIVAPVLQNRLVIRRE